MHLYYHSPLQDTPLVPDDPDNASPSDHIGNLIIPASVHGVKNNRQYKTISVRPMKRSQIDTLGQILVKEGWNQVLTRSHVDDKLDTIFSNIA